MSNLPTRNVIGTMNPQLRLRLKRVHSLLGQINLPSDITDKPFLEEIRHELADIIGEDPPPIAQVNRIVTVDSSSDGGGISEDSDMESSSSEDQPPRQPPAIPVPVVDPEEEEGLFNHIVGWLDEIEQELDDICSCSDCQPPQPTPSGVPPPPPPPPAINYLSRKRRRLASPSPPPPPPLEEENLALLATIAAMPPPEQLLARVMAVAPLDQAWAVAPNPLDLDVQALFAPGAPWADFFH